MMYGRPGKSPSPPSSGAPDVEPGDELRGARLDGRPLQPGLDGVLRERQEDALAAVLVGGEPGEVARQGRQLHVEVELAVDVGQRRVEPGEADLRGDLAQPVHEHQAVELAFGPGRQRSDGVGAGVEVALGLVLAEALLLASSVSISACLMPFSTGA
jgi:hypothetical protein